MWNSTFECLNLNRNTGKEEQLIQFAQRRCTKKNGGFAVQQVEKVSFLVGLRDGVTVTREREGEAKVWQNREAICDLFYGTLLQSRRGGGGRGEKTMLKRRISWFSFAIKYIYIWKKVRFCLYYQVMIWWLVSDKCWKIKKHIILHEAHTKFYIIIAADWFQRMDAVYLVICVAFTRHFFKTVILLLAILLEQLKLQIIWFYNSAQ